MADNTLKTSTAARFDIDAARLQQETEAVMQVIRQHLDHLSEQPVKAQVTPGSVAQGFAKEAPLHPTSFQALTETIQAKIIPALTHWQHPRFFAYYPAATSIPAVVSEFVIAALGSVGLQWSANPAATEMECVVMDWLMRMLHAADGSPFLHSSRLGGGIIQNTAGESIASIMVAARIHKHMNQDGRDSKSLTAEELEQIYWQDSSRFVVYMSDQTHFSGPKAVRVAGMRLHKIPAQILADGNYGISAQQLEAAMLADRAQGLTPCAVLLNYGSTNTCGYDDLESFRGLREREKVWVHVDAAYAGASLILPEFRDRALLIQELATSFNFNGSKWLLCGFDSAFLFVRDRQLLKAVYSASGDYMAKSEEEQTYNPEFKDWSIPLGRRFRALRIWMVLSYFGVHGMQQYVRESIQQANWFRKKLDSSSLLRQTVKTDLGLVCFQLASSSAQENEQFLSRLEVESENGKNFLIYPSQIGGQRFLRLALGGIHSQMSDLEFFWNVCEKAAKASLAAQAT